MPTAAPGLARRPVVAPTDEPPSGRLAVVLGCRSLAGDLQARAEGVTATVLGRVGDLQATDRTRDGLEADVRSGVRELVAELFDTLRDVEQPVRIGRAGAKVAAQTAGFARDGVPLAVLLRSLRTVHAEVTNAVVSRAGAVCVEPPVRDVVVITASRRLFTYIDELTQTVLDAYEAERGRMSERPELLRQQLVAEILAGADVDSGPAAVGLGHDLDGDQLGVVCWARRGDAFVDLDALVATLVDGLAVPGVPPALVTVVESGMRAVWFTADRAHLSAVAAALRAQAGGPESRLAVALGEPASGVEGFRTSHAEALLVRRLMTATGAGGEAVVGYGDVTLPALLSGDLERVTAYVRRELGPLAAPDAATARLRETLRESMVHGHSAAADVLGIHKNTVRYRVRQCEKLLGHGVGERRFEVELALRLAHAFRAALAEDPS